MTAVLFRLLTGVGASVMSSGSCDPLPRESTCKVVWSERKSEIPPTLSNALNSPPEKRRRLELLVSAMDSRNETTENRFCDFDPVESGLSFCLTLVTDRDALGSELVVAGSWRREGVEGMQTEELTRVKLTTRQMCSGELAIDHRCLAQWNGKTHPQKIDTVFAGMFQGRQPYLVRVNFTPRKLKICRVYWQLLHLPK